MFVVKPKQNEVFFLNYNSSFIKIKCIEIVDGDRID